MSVLSIVIAILLGIAFMFTLLWLFRPRRSVVAVQTPPDEDIQPVLISSTYAAGMQPYYVQAPQRSPVIIIDESNAYAPPIVVIEDTAPSDSGCSTDSGSSDSGSSGCDNSSSGSDF